MGPPIFSSKSGFSPGTLVTTALPWLYAVMQQDSFSVGRIKVTDEAVEGSHV
jgi:hypothetical protein